MNRFKLRHKLLVVVAIIVIMTVAWLLMQGLWHSFSDYSEPLIETEVAPQDVPYLEKIDQFALQQFDANQRLSYFVEAKNYFNFKNEPALLADVKVITYNQKGEEGYILTSKRAHYLDSGEIKFKGKVGIHTGTGVVHKIKTPELLVSTKTEDLISHKPVTYLGDRTKMVAQGMHMETQKDRIKLIGKTRISQDSGQTIVTKNLYIDQSNGQQHYYSKHATTYLATGNKIYAQGVDMDMRKQIVQLLGKVKILQKSGSEINTQDLIVDQSGDNEIYRTKNTIRYRSSVANIQAMSMRYDAKNQKIKLTGGVVGRYE